MSPNGDMCPDTTDFKIALEGALAFEKADRVDNIGFLPCSVFRSAAEPGNTYSPILV